MIIGISGKAGSGKDTAASMLEWIYSNPGKTCEDYEKHSSNNKYADVNISHFADILKEAVRHLLVVDEWATNTQEGKKSHIEWLGMTVREFLQKFGTAMRNIDNDFWVKVLWAHIDDVWDNVIIADVRYPNEAKSIKDRDGILVRIDRKGAGAGEHTSETALDDYNNWDYHIKNDGSLEDLFKIMQIIAREHPID